MHCESENLLEPPHDSRMSSRLSSRMNYCSYSFYCHSTPHSSAHSTAILLLILLIGIKSEKPELTKVCSHCTAHSTAHSTALYIKAGEGAVE